MKILARCPASCLQCLEGREGSRAWLQAEITARPGAPPGGGGGVLLGIAAGAALLTLCAAAAMHRGYAVPGRGRAAAVVHAASARMRNACHHYWLRLRVRTFCASRCLQLRANGTYLSPDAPDSSLSTKWDEDESQRESTYENYIGPKHVLRNYHSRT